MVRKDKVCSDRSNVFNFIGFAAAFLLLVGGIVANYYFARIPLPVRLVAWIVLVCAMVAVLWPTTPGRKLWKFFNDSRAELRRVVWPSRQQTTQTTVVVLVVVVIFAVVMWGADSFLMWAVSWLTGVKG